MSWTKLPTSRLALKKCSISLPFQIQIRHTLSICQAPPTRRHTHLCLLETTVACCGGPSLKSLILFRATPPRHLQRCLLQETRAACCGGPSLKSRILFCTTPPRHLKRCPLQETRAACCSGPSVKSRTPIRSTRPIIWSVLHYKKQERPGAVDQIYRARFCFATHLAVIQSTAYFKKQEGHVAAGQL